MVIPSGHIDEAAEKPRSHCFDLNFLPNHPAVSVSTTKKSVSTNPYVYYL